MVQHSKRRGVLITDWVELRVFLANGWQSGFLHLGSGIFFVALLRFLSIMNIRTL